MGLTEIVLALSVATTPAQPPKIPLPASRELTPYLREDQQQGYWAAIIKSYTE
jgi:hypothetical protein